MSHPEQLAFFRAVVAANARLVEGGRILEIGSYDVNGSVRAIFFAAAEYVGIDLMDGPGVDVVSFAHELDAPDGAFDLTISGECLEHDPHWRETFRTMWRLTRPGGLVAFTCATHGRPEHGTRRTDRHESPGTQHVGLDYYRNLDAADLDAALPLAEMFSDYEMWRMPTSFDLYFAGVKRGAGRPTAAVPKEAAVAAIERLMPRSHRVARLPLRGLVHIVPRNAYQTFALPYWRTLLLVQDKLAGGRFRRAAG